MDCPRCKSKAPPILYPYGEYHCAICGYAEYTMGKMSDEEARAFESGEYVERYMRLQAEIQRDKPRTNTHSADAARRRSRQINDMGLLTIPQAAERLGISLNALRQRIKRGTFPAINVKIEGSRYGYVHGVRPEDAPEKLERT